MIHAILQLFLDSIMIIYHQSVHKSSVAHYFFFFTYTLNPLTGAVATIPFLCFSYSWAFLFFKIYFLNHLSQSVFPPLNLPSSTSFLLSFFFPTPGVNSPSHNAILGHLVLQVLVPWFSLSIRTFHLLTCRPLLLFSLAFFFSNTWSKKLKIWLIRLD